LIFWVEPDFFYRFPVPGVSTPSFRMTCLRFCIDDLPLCQYLLLFSAMALYRRDKLNAAMVVFFVVPVYEGVYPFPCLPTSFVPSTVFATRQTPSAIYTMIFL
jgi:hypothetical protein